MARINWSAAFACGDATIDAQHQELFNRVNAFLEACAQGKGRDQLTAALDFLHAYCAEHFANEERMMRKAGYPGCEAHVELHSHLLNLAGELRTHLQSARASSSDVIIFAEALSKWLVDHIGREDQKVFAYMRTRG
jgi:hemerythrin